MAGVSGKVYDLSGYDNSAIEAAITHHRDRGVADSDLYRAMIEERAKRSSKSLNVDKTISLLIAAAKRRGFVSYKDVAEANGVNFSSVRYQVGKHLDTILDVCHTRGWPLLTALCVKQGEVEHGNLSGDSLKGFIAGVRRLRIDVTDAQAHLKKCQGDCFEWAEKS